MNRKLKAKIFEKFATPHDFSRTAGVHESHVSRVVQGRRTLTESERQEWAGLLGTDSTELWGRDVSNA
jgi:plasmid maintenance system antidote protein VapI